MHTATPLYSKPYTKTMGGGGERVEVARAAAMRATAAKGLGGGGKGGGGEGDGATTMSAA